MWYLHSLEHASAIQKLTILGCKNALVLSNTHVPVSGTWSILFPVNQNSFEVAALKLSILETSRTVPVVSYYKSVDCQHKPPGNVGSLCISTIIAIP